MDWIHILKCPLSGDGLRMMEPAELTQFRHDFSGLFSSQFGNESLTFDEALINEGGRYVYPLVDGIPLLITGAAFDKYSLNQSISSFAAEKKKVLDFYNSKGWTSSAGGDYADAVIYEDLRAVSEEYLLRCNDRVSRHLPASGKYLLDAASGAIQFESYLAYSNNFERRVCVDFSLLALKEARKKLGAKGIYVLCDITNMPFRDGVMDAFISLNTIYHVPANEQVKAVTELYRLLRAEGKGVLVYDWFKHSLWMNITLLPFRVFVFLKNRLLQVFRNLAGKKGSSGRLYFHAHTPEFMRQNLPPYRLFVWRTVSVPFLKYYVHAWLFGRAFLHWLYEFEEKFPERCGRYGEYPMFVFKKEQKA